jgi:hypothetical protein
MNRNERLDDHQKFKELTALAQRGTLSNSERQDLQRHLQSCDSCQRVFDEYSLISTEGMTFLAAAHGRSQDTEDWDDRPTRNKLFARIRAAEQSTSIAKPELLRIGRTFFPRSVVGQSTAAAVAACVLIFVAVGAYHLGGRPRLVEQKAQSTDLMHLQDDLTAAKKSSDQLIATQNAHLSQLQTQAASSQQEVARLHDALHAAEARFTALSALNHESDEQLRQVSEQRDELSAQLHDAEQSYQLVRAELTTLRAERDRLLLRATSLESKVDELALSAHDQDRRLKDDEAFLSSDRDIRELMGARKLYIADVFDVDSGSRTRKPFGRVFYTQSKSLIFYAFDLDHEPGVKNASAFQVWGKRDAEADEKNHAKNLGILYMDSETNRRWVLRLDDPKQLAEVDAVFVTVEPHGGSQKPTGKPFLYALLRREANHP